MLEDLFSRIKCSLENMCRPQYDESYGSPLERSAFTRCWIENHLELFHTITDSELIAEDLHMDLHQPSVFPDEVENQVSTNISRAEKKMNLSFMSPGEDNNITTLNKNKLSKLEDIDSGLPGTTIQTRDASDCGSLHKTVPTCNSYESLLKSLCNGFHYNYKLHPQTQCYFFTVFKKDKSVKTKKLKKETLDNKKLCKKCKVIVRGHESHSKQKFPCFNDLPKWSQQRKDFLAKKNKNYRKKSERKFSQIKSKSKVDQKSSKPKKKIKKPRNSSIFRRLSEKHTGGRQFGDDINSKLRALNKIKKKKSKSTKKCDKVVKVTPMYFDPTMIPYTKQEVADENDSEEKRTLNSESPEDRKRYCPAAYKLYEDLKTNCSLLKTLPKNWNKADGRVFENKHSLRRSKKNKTEEGKKYCPAAYAAMESFKTNCCLLTVLPKHWGSLLQRERVWF